MHPLYWTASKEGTYQPPPVSWVLYSDSVRFGKSVLAASHCSYSKTTGSYMGTDAHSEREVD